MLTKSFDRTVFFLFKFVQLHESSFVYSYSTSLILVQCVNTVSWNATHYSWYRCIRIKYGFFFCQLLSPYAGCRFRSFKSIQRKSNNQSTGCVCAQCLLLDRRRDSEFDLHGPAVCGRSKEKKKIVYTLCGPSNRRSTCNVDLQWVHGSVSPDQFCRTHPKILRNSLLYRWLL